MISYSDGHVETHRWKDARTVAAGDLPRTHWFWSEVWKVRREFWPIILAALIVNMLALATPLFIMSVYDRVIPNGAIPSLIATVNTLAIGVTDTEFRQPHVVDPHHAAGVDDARRIALA